MLDKILKLVPDTDFNKQFYEAILNRLDYFGCRLDENDAWAVCFSGQKVENHIKNVCNVTSIPIGLFYVAVDMVCGEFLFALKEVGKLDIESLNLDGVITSIKEGDTSVNFGSGSSDSEKVDILIHNLIHGQEGELVCYRQIKW